MWDAKVIHARLTAARRADPGFRQFGAGRHRHRLGPVLGEADVSAFEAWHRVTLPDAYRTFLLEVGDGGAGPHYGLFPLDGDGLRADDLEERSLAGHLATPFPHTEAWNPENHVQVDERPRPVDAMTECPAPQIRHISRRPSHTLAALPPLQRRPV